MILTAIHYNKHYENDSRVMPSSRFTVNEKATLKNPSICSMFQNAIIGNVAINIYVGRDALV